MKKIYLLTDYKGRFGSKHDDKPYRSGMDLTILKNSLMKEGYEAEFVPFSNVNSGEGSWKEQVVLFTSAEDKGFIYKQYIEDVVYALELAGARVIPSFRFLRAHNNKVFMELLRGILPGELRGNLVSTHYGTLEELSDHMGEIEFPVVVKGSSGAMGRNVYLAHTSGELSDAVRKKIASETTMAFRLKEYLRQLKHNGYRRDSFYRGRFVVQKFIPGLKNDWKVYFFGDKAFVFSRPVFKKREFRASGGGYDNYSYGLAAGVPEGLLDFGWSVFRALNVPFISVDLAWDGSRFYLLEFQCVYFGTAGILRKYSGEFFLRGSDSCQVGENRGIVEEVVAEGLGWFL